MIAIREVRSEDKDTIRRWRNLPEVADYMYTDRTITAEEHEEWFTRILNDSTCHYWIITCDHVDMGLACIYGIDEYNKKCSWAFYLADPNVRGKGIGSFVEYCVLEYVFDQLKFHKLCCEVLEFNQSVINLHKSFGFQQEGLFREHIRKNKTRHNVVAFAILRREWLANKMQLQERLRRKGLLQVDQR